MKRALDKGRHLTGPERLAHAESLVDGGTPIDAALAAHLAACEHCAQEVEAMRRSFEVTRHVAPIEPSAEATAQLLMQARRLRQSLPSTPARTARFSVEGRRLWTVWAAAASFVCCVGLGVMWHGQPAAPVIASVPLSQTTEAPKANTLQKTAQDVRMLAAAVRTPTAAAASPREMAQRREVQAMDADIAAALAALQRNPGCARATQIVQANLERQKQTLRTLYTERSL